MGYFHDTTGAAKTAKCCSVMGLNRIGSVLHFCVPQHLVEFWGGPRSSERVMAAELGYLERGIRIPAGE